jgi:uncharacterized protein YndB with AHSA1/START domain
MSEGQAADDAESQTITLVCELDEPPRKVWRALTEPGLLARWLMPNDFTAEQGAKFSFRPDDGAPPIACEVRALDRERLLEYSWQAADDVDSVVRFELLPRHTGGTLLILTHRGVAASPLVDAFRAEARAAHASDAARWAA